MNKYIPRKTVYEFCREIVKKKSSNLENLSTKEAKETVMELALNLNVMYIVGSLLRCSKNRRNPQPFRYLIRYNRLHTCFQDEL